jgi:hypothetical protein
MAANYEQIYCQLIDDPRTQALAERRPTSAQNSCGGG